MQKANYWRLRHAHFTKCQRSRLHEAICDVMQGSIAAGVGVGGWMGGGVALWDRGPEREAGTGLRRLAICGRSTAPVCQGLDFKRVKSKKNQPSR